MKLIDVNKDNWEEVILLTTDKDGKHLLGEEFVASNAYSLVQAAYEKEWVVKAIENDGIIIGFAMYGWYSEGEFYKLCRFMIDRKYQGKGYGKEALGLIINEIRKKFFCDEIYLSVESKNIKAKHIYEKIGFVSTGKIIEDEELYKMKF